MALWAPEVLQIALLLSLFATSHLLNSPFGRIGVLEHHSLPTNASPAGSLGTGQTRLSVLATAAPTATGPCQLPQPLPLTNKRTIERLGTDEYRNVVDPFSSFVGIEETGLLERSYVDYFEGSESVVVKGRLRANVHFWESIGASHFVLSVIREGYKIPFYYTPTSVFLPNNKSALHNANFVLGAITELLKVGSVVQCPCPAVVVNPLSVSIQPNGKKRLILDLRHVNFFVKKSKIKFEDAKSFLECLVASPCAWACSFDIKSGYHHIEIFESDQQFLGFSWVFDGVTKYFKFTVLPFGLSVGPYIFSKVMRPLVKYWRSKAIRIVVYLDDGISAVTNFSKCQGNSLLVRSDLLKSGFVANKDKCQWFPLQVICWLGIFWDFKNNRMFIPPEKISGILEEVVEIMPFCSISARKLARVTGRIISNFLIMGDVCKLMTKSLHRLIECRRDWDAQLVLDADVLMEVKFWSGHLRSLNCRPIWRKTVLPSRIVYSDASAVGCAALSP